MISGGDLERSDFERLGAERAGPAVVCHPWVVPHHAVGGEVGQVIAVVVLRLSVRVVVGVEATDIVRRAREVRELKAFGHDRPGRRVVESTAVVAKLTPFLLCRAVSE